MSGATQLGEPVQAPPIPEFGFALRDLPKHRQSAVHCELGNYDPREQGCGLRYADGAPKMLWNALLAHGTSGIRRGACFDGRLRDMVRGTALPQEPAAAALR